MEILMIGGMEVDGEDEFGIFIRADIEEIKLYRHLFGEKVILKKAEQPKDCVSCKFFKEDGGCRKHMQCHSKELWQPTDQEEK